MHVKIAFSLLVNDAGSHAGRIRSPLHGMVECPLKLLQGYS